MFIWDKGRNNRFQLAVIDTQCALALYQMLLVTKIQTFVLGYM